MLRILVADDHEPIRRLIREILEAETDWEVCSEAANGWEAVKLASRTKPDIVVLDLSMPELNGFDATREILNLAPQTESVIVTVHDNKELLEAAMACGARACVLKSKPDDLVAVIRAMTQPSSRADNLDAE